MLFLNLNNYENGTKQPKNMKALVKLIRLGKNHAVYQIYSTLTMISPENHHCVPNKVEKGHNSHNNRSWLLQTVGLDFPGLHMTFAVVRMLNTKIYI